MKHTKQSERLRKIVDAFPRLTITVVADLVADEFIYGEISRVSREAPVLILKHRERTVVPGGGGNAVYNLAALGVTVLPVGVVGDDEPGRLLLRAFRQKRISTSGILRLKGYTTVTKTRILAGMTHTARQQVVRVDREPESELDFMHQQDLVASANRFLRASDALLISDYGYGAATPQMLKDLRSRGTLKDMPVTLDSRYRLLEYAGVTAATPNEPEVEHALGLRIGADSDAPVRRRQEDSGAHEAGRRWSSPAAATAWWPSRGAASRWRFRFTAATRWPTSPARAIPSSPPSPPRSPPAPTPKRPRTWPITPAASW